MDRRTLLKTGLFSILGLMVPLKAIAKPKEPHIWGQKTLTKSTFERMNIGSILEHIKKDTQIILKYFEYEINDFHTRTSIKMLLNEYLQKVKNRKGIKYFKVVCDETNNTPNMIDRNEGDCMIYLRIQNGFPIYRINHHFYPESFLFANDGLKTTIENISYV